MKFHFFLGVFPLICTSPKSKKKGACIHARKRLQIWGLLLWFTTCAISSRAMPKHDPSISEVQRQLELKNETLAQVIKKMEGITPFPFVYEAAALQAVGKLPRSSSTQTVASFLHTWLATTAISYWQVKDQLFIDRQDSASPVKGIPYPFDKTVSGQVTNSKNQPLEGVNVRVKGSSVGTLTDGSGRYTITVGEAAVLLFSSVGFLPREVVVGSQVSIDVRLQEDERSLSDVVVTALGVRRNVKSLTYSTQTVNPQQLTEAREVNLLTSLQGKVAGLSVTASGSGVGSDVRVVLRGNRSIDGDSQPLYVIDGIPISGIPADLSPDNIASLNILKGANAAALYGSDAQNGVIIIETKKGSTGTHVQLNQTFMVQEPYQLLPFQNVYGQGYSGTYYNNAEAAWGPKMEGQPVDTWSLDPADAGKKYSFLPQPHNKLDVFQKGYNLASNIIASMGGEKTQALFSYTFTNAKGILPHNELRRHNMSLRITSKLAKRLALDAKLEYLYQDLDNLTAEGGDNLNPLFQIYTMPPNIRTADVAHYEFTDPDGNKRQNWWNPSSQDGENPYWVLNRDLNTNNKRRALMMTSLTYSFTDALRLMVRAAYDGSNGTWNRKWHNDTYNVAAFGMYWEGEQQDLYVTTDFLLSFNKEWHKDWSLKASLGGNAAKYRNSALYSNTGLALLAPNLFSMTNTNMPVTSFDPGAPYNKNSLYAFSTLAWKNAVFLDITGRNDWSSTLPAENRSYFYPSIGLSAVLTDLIPSLPSVFSFAKIRVSRAEVGKDTRPYMLQRTADFGPGGVNGFLQLSSLLPNLNLLPEKTRSSEIGLDLRWFHSRLGVDLTLYQTETKNQLFQLSLPVGSGASSYFTNGGNVRNKGVELILTGTPIRSQSFEWTAHLNFARNQNKVVQISDASPRLIVPGNDSYFKDFVIEQGQPYGQLYGKGWKRDGEGRVIIGTDGLPLVTEGRTVLLANFTPKWAGGLQSQLRYKNLTLSLVIDHRQGGTLVSSSNAVIDGLGLSERTLQGRDGGLVFGENFFAHETAVLQNGTHNGLPIKAQDFWTYVGGVNAPTGEAFVIDATNTRLRELTLGYSVPAFLVRKIKATDAKISVVGRNLFFLARASRYADPDIMLGTDKTSEGFQAYNPPTSRYYGLNLKLSF